MPDEKSKRRHSREQAVKLLNALAVALGVDAIPLRSPAEDVAEHYENLCEHGTAEHVEKIAEARTLWVSNGGGELNEDSLLALAGSKDNEVEDATSDFPGGEEPVKGHHRVHTASRKDGADPHRREPWRQSAREFSATNQSSSHSRESPVPA